MISRQLESPTPCRGAGSSLDAGRGGGVATLRCSRTRRVAALFNANVRAGATETLVYTQVSPLARCYTNSSRAKVMTITLMKESSNYQRSPSKLHGVCDYSMHGTCLVSMQAAGSGSGSVHGARRCVDGLALRWQDVYARARRRRATLGKCAQVQQHNARAEVCASLCGSLCVDPGTSKSCHVLTRG